MLVGIAYILCGCSVTFQNAIQEHDYSRQNLEELLATKEYRIIKDVYGEGKATYILTIGGLSKNAKNIFATSYNNMVKSARLKDNQAIINISAEKRVNLGLYPIYARQVVHTKGTVIEFLDKSDGDKKHDAAENNKEEVKNRKEDMPKETEPPYRIGDVYNKGGKNGVVFYATPDGMHGKIVSLSECQAVWCNKTIVSVKTGATDKADGKKNLEAIQKISGWQTKFPAFSACTKLGNDWYLPSIEELQRLLTNLDRINPRLQVPINKSNVYVSSSEDLKNPKNVHRIYFGQDKTTSKTVRFSIRAITEF